MTGFEDMDLPFPAIRLVSFQLYFLCAFSSIQLSLSYFSLLWPASISEEEAE